MFKSFDQRIPDDRRMPLEFERLNLFHKKYGKSMEEIWSNDLPEGVATFKPRSFKGCDIPIFLGQKRPT